jgi:hypothetical protein
VISVFTASASDNDLRRSTRRAPQHNGCAVCGEKPGRRFAYPAACSGDDDDFAFNTLRHHVSFPEALRSFHNRPNRIREVVAKIMEMKFLNFGRQIL